MKVGDFLTAPLPEWDWTAQDCCRWVDRWLQARDHASAIRALGLHWTTEKGALRVIRRGGGLVPLWSAGMALIGVPEVDEPQAGDIAVIKRATLDRLDQSMAIYTGSRWASLGLRGLEFGPADALKVWRV